MTIEYKKGDIIEFAETGRYDALLHGCNCQSRMGSGVAKAIKARFPEAYERDRSCPLSPEEKLGEYTVVDCGVIRVYNLYTQFYYGTDRKHLEEGALEHALRLVSLDEPGDFILMPMIGCGLAGGSWDEVEPIVNDVLTTKHVTVVSL